MCYYLIHAPKGYLESGHLILKFLKVEDLDIYLYDTDSDDAVSFDKANLINKQDGNVELNKKYELAINRMFIVIAVSKSEKTVLHLEYKAIGNLNPFYIHYYERYFTNEQSSRILIVLAVVISLYLCIYICLTVYCCSRCCRKKNNGSEELSDQSVVKAQKVVPKNNNPWSSEEEDETDRDKSSQFF